jgi:hypothetical protein
MLLGLSRPGETAEFCEQCGVCHEPTTQDIRAMVTKIVQETLGRDV